MEINTKLRKVQQKTSDIYYIYIYIVLSMFSNKKPSRLYCSIAWVSRAYFFFMIIYLQYPFVAIIHYTFRFFFFININSSQYSMKVFSLSIKFWSTSTSTSHILCIGFLVVFVLLTKKGTFYPDFVA